MGRGTNKHAGGERAGHRSTETRQEYEPKRNQPEGSMSEHEAQRRRPPMKPSEESTRETLNMAREQGHAYQTAAEYMMKEEAHGAEKHSGDYIVGYAVEKAEGMYMLHEGQLQWKEPTNENAHLEIVVRDAADGRFIPGLKVQATLVDRNGQEVGTHPQNFIWHPWLFHYGRNWRIPEDGVYTIRVHIDPPDFGRHDKVNGMRYAEPVDIEFPNVHLETGKKEA